MRNLKRPETQVNSGPIRNVAAVLGAGFLTVGGVFFALRAPTQTERDSSRIDTGRQPAPTPSVEQDSAYQEFSKRLDALADPRDLRDELQLQQLAERLAALPEPSDKMASWANTPAVRRRDERLADARALDLAVYQQRRRFRTLVDEGEKVLREKEAPDLPGRAKAVLDRGNQAPGPTTGRDVAVGLSRRLTFTVVFDFPSVKEAVAEWEKVKQRLSPLQAP